MNQTNIAPNSMNDIGQNVNYLWRGMIGDIIWSAKAIKGAALEEINMYQAVKFGTVGYLNEPKSRGNTYDLSKTADKINLLDDILLLNQTADSGNGDETVTVAGADFVTTGNGSDTLILKDLAFRYLDGGKGEDVLRLDASFNTSNTIYLSDYVSNARGMVGTSDDNARVNLNGFHKLMGIETIDLSSNTKAQTLSISADDVWQLSDTHSLKIKMDSQDLLLTQNLGSQLQGHFYLDVTGSWYDSYYSPNTAQSMTLYTQGGDTLTRMVSFDLSNNNKILDLNFDHTLKVNVGSTLQIGDFSISGLGPYTFAAGGVNSSNPTTVSFNDLQQSLRFQSTDSINGPVLITYNGNQLQDSQGRVLPSYTWMIGSDAPNQDYDQYKVLIANQLSLSTQKKGVMMLGGGGEDLLVGALGADTLVGGLDSDTLIGGDGSDTFVFAQESGDIAGPTGDVIQDFNLGKNGGLQSDTLSLYHLFDTALVNQLGKGSVNDAAKLANYLKFEWTHDANNLQLVCSIDTTGQGHFSKLVTMTDLLDSVGTVNYDASKPDQTRLYGGETSNALLQKLLEEGRLVIQ
jgi:Ca2+-binding RTX toxin-like protein